MFIVILGNLCDGFRHFGPFDSFDEACQWTEESRLDEPSWIATLESPDDEGRCEHGKRYEDGERCDPCYTERSR